MIAKIRISTPSSAPVIAVETGSGMLTDARRTMSHASRMIVRSPRTTPGEAAPAAERRVDAELVGDPSDVEVLPGQEQVDEEQHALRRA